MACLCSALWSALRGHFPLSPLFFPKQTLSPTPSPFFTALWSLSVEAFYSFPSLLSPGVLPWAFLFFVHLVMAIIFFNYLCLLDCLLFCQPWGLFVILYSWQRYCMYPSLDLMEKLLYIRLVYFSPFAPVVFFCIWWFLYLCCNTWKSIKIFAQQLCNYGREVLAQSLNKNHENVNIGVYSLSPECCTLGGTNEKPHLLGDYCSLCKMQSVCLQR